MGWGGGGWVGVIATNPAWERRGGSQKKYIFLIMIFLILCTALEKKIPMFLKCSRHKAVLSVAYILKSTYLLLN